MRVENKTAAITLITSMVFLILLLINAIKAHKVQRVWFIAGVIVAIGIAWILNFAGLWK